MSDHSVEIRKAVITKLKGAGAVAAIVAARVHDEVPAEPTWPFIRYGLADLAPYATSCADGSDHEITIHTFSKGAGSGAIGALNAAVVTALDDAELDLGALGFYGIDWLGTQVMPDGAEKSAYHGIIRFAARTLDN